MKLLKMAQKNKEEGIVGIGTQFLVDDKSKQVKLVFVPEGFPAYEAGVRVNDLLISVDGFSVNGLSISKVLELLGGEENDFVTLKIKIVSLSRLCNNNSCFFRMRCIDK